MTSSNQNNLKKEWLLDVAAIRIILILLLVMYHALCPFTGNWSQPYSGFHNITAYKWIGLLTHQGQLEGMTFISGLLMGFSLYRRNNTFNLGKSIFKKAKRILLPCFFFGIIYYLLFYDMSANWASIVYKILNGCGHLWFLPMIFWCFVITYILAHYPPLQNKITIYYIVLAISCMFVILNPLQFLPLGIGNVGNYYMYFLIGFGLKQNIISFPKYTLRRQFIAILVFCAAFVVYMLLKNGWQKEDILIMKAIRLASFNICTLLTSINAIYTFYGVANRSRVINWLKSKPALITLSGYCYGVYIYQQFILQFLYYKTNIPITVSEYALPWIGFAVTLFLSLALCWITLKTRFGRFLIG